MSEGGQRNLFQAEPARKPLKRQSTRAELVEHWGQPEMEVSTDQLTSGETSLGWTSVQWLLFRVAEGKKMLAYCSLNGRQDSFVHSTETGLLLAALCDRAKHAVDAIETAKLCLDGQGDSPELPSESIQALGNIEKAISHLKGKKVG
jgi:hypothetical protein